MTQTKLGLLINPAKKVKYEFKKNNKEDYQLKKIK